MCYYLGSFLGYLFILSSSFHFIILIRIITFGMDTYPAHYNLHVHQLQKRWEQHWEGWEAARASGAAPAPPRTILEDLETDGDLNKRQKPPKNKNRLGDSQLQVLQNACDSICGAQ
jgi:hypothetical protein